MKIDCITKRADGNFVHTSVENRIENLQKHVGGYIEVLSLFPASSVNGVNLVILCDEDGKPKNKAPNITFFGTTIVGDIVICGMNRKGEFVDMPLTFHQVKALIDKAK